MLVIWRHGRAAPQSRARQHSPRTCPIAIADTFSSSFLKNAPLGHPRGSAFVGRGMNRVRVSQDVSLCHGTAGAHRAAHVARCACLFARRLYS